MLYMALLMPLLIVCRAVIVLQINKYWKILLALAVLAAALKYQIVHFFGGGMFFAPDLPAEILITANWIYAWELMFFILLAGSETILSVVKIIRKLQKKTLPADFRHCNNVLNLILLICGGIFAGYLMFAGMRQPEVKELNIVCEKLPAAADNLRIVLLADLHIDRINSGSKIRKIVEKVNVLAPDLIIIAGDVVDGTVKQRSDDVKLLGDLRSRYGVYGVPGNHEYFSGYTQWMEFFESINLKMLKNSHVKLPCGIYLAGVTDHAAKRRNLPMPDVAKAVQGIDRHEFVLLASHRPSEAIKASALGIDLQFSGHTHGGMIRGFDLIVARFNDYLVSGLYRINGLQLYVSNGTLIWNGFPFRLGRSSEITLITLKKQ